MGLGKSAQAITAADIIKAKRILVVCPAVARINWDREFQKFSKIGRKFQILTTLKDIISQNSIIISFDLLTRLNPACLGQFDVLIIDEVHYAKNIKAKRTHAIFGKKGIIHEQSKNSKCKTWVLSGTPAPNHAGELWPLLYTFGVTDLKNENFIQRFCHVRPGFSGKGWQVAGTKRDKIPELRGLLAKIMLRRMKAELGTEIPPIFFSNLVVESGEVDYDMDLAFVNYLYPENRIAELEERLKAELQSIDKAINTQSIEVLKGLAKSVSMVRRYIGIQKVEKIAELVKSELDANLYEKIVIFAIHRGVIEGLRNRLRDYNPLVLYGGSKFNKAHGNIDKFNNYGKYRVFIANITAAGIAINLTAAHNVLMAEQEWTPAANAQAIARCHRHGQRNPVNVRFVGLANSLDERVCEILARKTKDLTDIFEPDTNREITISDLLL